MLFLAVLINFQNSKVCLIGNGSISIFPTIDQFRVMGRHLGWLYKLLALFTQRNSCVNLVFHRSSKRIMDVNFKICGSIGSEIKNFFYLTSDTTIAWAITVGRYHLTHPVYFPCGMKPDYPEETHDFRQSVDFYSFHMRTELESHWEILTENRTRDLRGERKTSGLTTKPPKPPNRCFVVAMCLENQSRWRGLQTINIYQVLKHFPTSVSETRFVEGVKIFTPVSRNTSTITWS